MDQFTVQDGVIIRLAEEDKGKKKNKGDGVGSALVLMKEVISFLDKVNACADSQDITENKTAIQNSAKSVEDLYKVLLKIAESGIRSITSDTDSEVEAKTPEATEVTEVAEAPKHEELSKALLDTPSIPKMGKI